jgi:hypothetical protein
VRGRTATGPWEARIELPPTSPGEGRTAVAALFGREAVEDLETRLAAGGDAPSIDAQIEALGLRHRIATRLTSWVAIAEEPSVDPGRPFKRVRVPHAVPYGTSVEGLGLRATAMFGRPLLGSLSRVPAPMSAAAPAAPRRESAGGKGGGPPDAGWGAWLPWRRRARDEGGPRRLKGRATARKDRLEVEILVEGSDLPWSPPRTVVVVWANGAQTSEPVTRATRAVLVKSGQQIRLSLDLSNPSNAGAVPRQIELESCGERWVVEL